MVEAARVAVERGREAVTVREVVATGQVVVVKVVAARAAVRKVGRLEEAEATEATEATGAMGATEALLAATEQMVVVVGRWPWPRCTAI